MGKRLKPSIIDSSYFIYSEYILKEKSITKTAGEKLTNKYTGELAGGWRGWKTKESTLIRNKSNQREWSKNILSRDDYVCWKCGERGGELHAHHLLFFSSYPGLRLEPKNGITLCKNCHFKRHQKLRKQEKQLATITKYFK